MRWTCYSFCALSRNMRSTVALLCMAGAGLSRGQQFGRDAANGMDELDLLPRHPTSGKSSNIYATERRTRWKEVAARLNVSLNGIG